MVTHFLLWRHMFSCVTLAYFTFLHQTVENFMQSFVSYLHCNYPIPNPPVYSIIGHIVPCKTLNLFYKIYQNPFCVSEMKTKTFNFLAQISEPIIIIYNIKLF